VTSKEAVIGNAIAFSTAPIFDDSSLEYIVTSLRRSVDRKSRQRHAAIPHVLTMALGHSRLHWDWLIPLFHERIFPNSKYKWMSALNAFTPQRNWTANTLPITSTFAWNPKATIAAPKSMHEIVEHRATFRLWNRF
jgi:hypothetical protein